MICFRYEEKRVRKVNERWMVGRPWLKIIDEKSMMCTWCTQSDANNSCSFTWNSAKLETLKLHESSKIYEKNAIIEANKSMPVGSTEAEKLIENLNVAIMDRLVMLFRTAHAISLAGRPFTDSLVCT